MESMEFTMNNSNGSVTNQEENLPLGVLGISLLIFYIFAGLGVVGNFLLVLTVYRRPPLHRVSYYSVSALAIEDLISSVISTTNYPQGVIFGEWVLGDTMCVVIAFLSAWMGGSELFLVTAICADRYIACCRPLHYYRVVTTSRAKLTIVVCLGMSFVLSMPPFCGNDAFTYSATADVCQLGPAFSLRFRICSILFVTLAILPCSLVMMVCQYKMMKQVRKVTQAPPNVLVARGQKTSWNSNKATITVSLMTGIYVICWIPFVAVRSFGSLIDWSQSASRLQTLSALEKSTMYLFMVSKFANPIIYGLHNQEFRQEFKKMLRG